MSAKLNAKQKLLKHLVAIHPKGAFPTSVLAKWGIAEGYSTSAMRNGRDLASEGFLRRINKSMYSFYGYTGCEGLYEVTAQGRAEAKELSQSSFGFMKSSVC